ncbi:MAG: efflux RND transporter periplasmic adaptor subunit, partial [Marinilabilia sp.]
MNAFILNQKIRFVLTVLLGALVACGGSSDDQEGQEEETPRVETEHSTIRNVEQDLDLTGNVEAFEHNQITPAMQQRIQKIFVEVGDEVRKGQALVQMDSSQLRQTQAQLH